eukprot:SM000018S03564  [mRNA]  locus=s18:68416:70835:+ [translate_table: standard]
MLINGGAGALRRRLGAAAARDFLQRVQPAGNGGSIPVVAHGSRQGPRCWKSVLAGCTSSALRRRRASCDLGGGKTVASAASTGEASTQKPPRRRRRLDEVCMERFPEYSRSTIQSWIVQGKVLVGDKPAVKSGTMTADDAQIRITAEVPRFVCRAGYKLEGALEHFRVDVTDKVALDAGLSTGGFTDCLLQRGALRVYGVDVGYGQVSEKIRTDKRVVVMERTNLRHLPGLPEPVDIVTLDLSFISILLVLPAVCSVMKTKAELITLIKPQFEARREQVGGGGIVRDAQVHSQVVEKIVSGVESLGLQCHGWIPSPLKGTDGNQEFLAYFSRQ